MLADEIITVIENNLYKVSITFIGKERMTNVLKTSASNVETKCQVVQI